MRNLHEKTAGIDGNEGRPVCDGIMDILVCPVCGARLTRGEASLICEGCRVRYPIIDGVPVLLAREAQPLA